MTLFARALFPEIVPTKFVRLRATEANLIPKDRSLAAGEYRSCKR